MQEYSVNEYSVHFFGRFYLPDSPASPGTMIAAEFDDDGHLFVHTMAGGEEILLAATHLEDIAQTLRDMASN